MAGTRRVMVTALLAAAMSAAVTALNPILDSTGSEAGNVGWFDGPSGRGTSSLVSSCASTIFASTWTVLHLNLPSPDDGSLTRLLRKVKWMLINILFPEFVFSKAICELRLALRDHLNMAREMDRVAEQDPWEAVELIDVNATDRAYVLRTWSWRVEVSKWQRALHQAFGLTDNARREAAVLDSQDQTLRGAYTREPNEMLKKMQEEAESKEQTRIDEERAHAEAREKAQGRRTHELRVWTLTHTLYANMGGLFQPYYFENSTNHKPYPLTAASIAWGNWEGPHPLKGLVLSEEDIKDKSKADSLVKLIAVGQSLLVVANVAARRALDMPVTQLEIGTVAFCVVSVFTYLANWWKPKEVEVPTYLRVRTRHIYGQFSRQDMQPYLNRMISPIESENRDFAAQLTRIRNDDVWMEGDVPLVTTMMAISSFVFGGIHCLAWNFEFPTRLEQLLWRISAVATAGLPTLLLVINIFLYLWGTRMARASLLKLLRRSLPNFPETWWESLRDYPPDEEVDALRENLQPGQQPSNAHFIISHYRTLLWSLYCTFVLRQSAPTVEYTGDVVDSFRQLSYGMAEGTEPIWKEYEASLKRRVSKKGITLPEEGFRDSLVAIRDKILRRETRLKAREQECDAASRALTIITSVIYALARLILLAILFSSLRSVPAAVYDDVDWIRFVPHFA